MRGCLRNTSTPVWRILNQIVQAFALLNAVEDRLRVGITAQRESPVRDHVGPQLQRLQLERDLGRAALQPAQGNQLRLRIGEGLHSDAQVIEQRFVESGRQQLVGVLFRRERQR